MIFSNMWEEVRAYCYGRKTEKISDINFDGVVDVLVDGFNECDENRYPFIDFGTTPQSDFTLSAEDDWATDYLIFKTGMKLGFRVAAQQGAPLFSVGEEVQLLDGRRGKIQGFTFVVGRNPPNQDYQHQDTRVEVMLKGATVLMDVSLLDLIHRKK